MSIEIAKTAVDKIINDKGLRKEVISILPDGTAYVPGQESELFSTIADALVEKGYDLTADELTQATNEAIDKMGKFKSMGFLLRLQKELKKR